MTQGDDGLIALLNRAKYLLLRYVSEPENNALRIVVEEATANQDEVVLPHDPASPFSEILKGGSPIRPTEKSKTFELRWSNYVAYLVTEEVAGSGGNNEQEVYTGHLFRTYTKSHFLNYISRNTNGHTEPILHYKLICQNHLIDIAAYRPPEVRLLGLVSESEGTQVRPN